MYILKSTKATPVIGVSSADSGDAKRMLRRTAWAANPTIQAAASGTRWANRKSRNVPEMSTPAGSSHSAAPRRFSVNSYGAAIPTHGKTSNVRVMPELDGLKKWRIPRSVGTRKTAFDAIAAAEANASGHSAPPAYSRNPTDRLVM